MNLVVAGPLGGGNDGIGRRSEDDPNLVVARPVTGTMFKGLDDDTDTLVVAHALRGQGQLAHRENVDTYVVSPTLGAYSGRQQIEQPMIVTHALTGEGHDASEDGTGRGVPIVAQTLHASDGGQHIERDLIAFDTMNQTVGDISPTLRDPNGTFGDGLPAVAFASHALTLQGFAAIVDAYADAAQADADQVLRFLRDAVGTPEGARRGLGVLAPFFSAEVLRHAVHGARVQGAIQGGGATQGGALPSQDVEAPSEVRGVRHPGRATRRTSSRRKPAEQRPGEPDCAVPVMPPSPAQEARGLLGLWESDEGARLLRQALSAIQEVGRSAGVQAEPAHAALAVRRLVPVETERLQGFPDGWTCLCQSLADYARDPESAAERCTCPDSPRYRQMGNAVTVSVIEWLGRRLAQVA